MSSKTLADRLRLYLVAGTREVRGDFLGTVEAALKGGVTAIQLREKETNDRSILRLTEHVRELCQEHNALFLLNDRLDLALAAGADGVHLGVDDLPVPAARRIAGERIVVGFSPETDAGAISAEIESSSYLGVGPVFGTGSKLDAGPAIGLRVLERRAHSVNVPVVGIGGITRQNAEQVIRSGAAGVAVMSAILKSPDPEGAARALREAVDAAF